VISLAETEAFVDLIVTAAILIPVRLFVLCATLFHAPRARHKFLKLWPFLLLLDELWALSPSCSCITSTSEWPWPA
jgi:predicted branched-subunit amino acid permease